MGIWPLLEAPQPVCWSSNSRPALGVNNAGYGVISGMGAAGNALTANRAYLQPFDVSERVVVLRMAVWNGSTAPAASNLDLGIYTADGRLVDSSGSFARSVAADGVSEGTLDAALDRGRYYAAVACNGTGNLRMPQSLAGSSIMRMFGFAEAASSFPLPVTITPAAYTTSSCPFIVTSTRTLIG